MILVFTEEEESGIRLDRYLARQLPNCSRARLQTLIRDGHILLNGVAVKPRHPLSPGDTIAVTLPDADPASVHPEDISLDVLFEDDDLIVINKESGMVVHPGAGVAGGTLVNALLHHCRRLSGVGGPLRPGIVHRLDKDTSGCLVAAKNDATHHALTSAFSGRRVEKKYLAVLERCPARKEDRIESHIGRHPINRLRMAEVPPPAGKRAVTSYVVRHMGDSGATLVECDLHTGRTHQIRVHMKSLGTPILGDEIYAHPARQGVKVPRLMLHAWKLAFAHPVTGAPLSFEARIPDAFTPFLPGANRP